MRKILMSVIVLAITSSAMGAVHCNPGKGVPSLFFQGKKEWIYFPSQTCTFSGAQNVCSQAKVAEGSGWSLPSQADAQADSPSMMKTAQYWTSQCEGELCDKAILVNGKFSSVKLESKDAESLKVFCVR